MIDSPPLNKEIFLIDGGSTDGTIERIQDWSKKDSRITLVINPNKYVPQGFNKAFRKSKAPYISLMGAHATYPPNFFEAALEKLENREADAVGGPLLQKGRTWKGKVIAYCMSEKWGVGGTEFRTSKKKQFVQSVAFAVYNKKVFEKAGLLDEDLIRNQDDEFHYRLNHLGFRILMVPELACTYYVRESLTALWKQYFGYGLYKPLVLKKVNNSLRIRHIIPALFTLYWVIPLTTSWFWSITWIPGILYFLFNAGFSIKVGNGYIKRSFYAFWVFPTLHFAYGLGFIKGYIQPPTVSGNKNKL